jgi:hypothetical protein
MRVCACAGLLSATGLALVHARTRALAHPWTRSLANTLTRSPEALTWRRQLLTVSAACRRSSCGRNSAVECQLPKLDVAGSTPVARSLSKSDPKTFQSRVDKCGPLMSPGSSTPATLASGNVMSTNGRRVASSRRSQAAFAATRSLARRWVATPPAFQLQSISSSLDHGITRASERRCRCVPP